MLVPLLALAMLQKEPVPVAERGSALYTACLANIRIMDKTSNAESDIDEANTCMDYIDGFQAALALTTSPICVNGGSLGTLIRIYVDYMQKHAKMMDADKSLGVYGAMLLAYPCQKK